MPETLGRILVGVAVLALVHAGFSTYEHLSLLKALSKPPGAIPTSIIIEACISLFLFIPGLALATSELEDVTWRGEQAKRSTEDWDARMGFLPLGPHIREAHEKKLGLLKKD